MSKFRLFQIMLDNDGGWCAYSSAALVLYTLVSNQFLPYRFVVGRYTNRISFFHFAINFIISIVCFVYEMFMVKRIEIYLC